MVYNFFSRPLMRPDWNVQNSIKRGVMEKKNSCGKEVVWFVAGSMIGAGVALLFAPQSGKRTRQDIQKLGKAVWKRADRFTEDIQDSLGNLVDEVSEATENAVRAGRDISIKTKEEVMDILDSGRKFLEEEKRRWEKTFRA
jgi:gas vesicle protein